MPPTLVSTTFSLSLLGLTMHRKHLVSALLCLEGLMLTLFTATAMPPCASHYPTTTMNPIILLALAACEAGAGLAILVAMTRAYASDNLKNLNLLMC